MILLLVLAATTGAAACWQVARGTFSIRGAARLGLAAAMVVAGIAHLVTPAPFLQHLPPWVPAAAALIALTGVIEIVLGLALLSPEPWRQRAGLALAGYLVAVFPGNVYVAVAGIEVEGQPGGWYPWLRLPLQVLVVGWAVWSTRGARVPTSDNLPGGRSSVAGRPSRAGAGPSRASGR